jgi:hypothetical protein
MCPFVSSPVCISGGEGRERESVRGCTGGGAGKDLGSSAREGRGSGGMREQVGTCLLFIRKILTLKELLPSTTAILHQ